MNKRALTSTSITSSSLSRSRHRIKRVSCTAKPTYTTSERSVFAMQKRTFWSQGWMFYSHHDRVKRREIMHDMTSKYRGQYMLLKRMAKRRSVDQNFWQWQDGNGSSRQSYTYQRSERGPDRRESERHRNRWHGDLDELAKIIEADPYNFLFGRSNQYLQLPRSWSAFCRSFLNPGISAEQAYETSSAKEPPSTSTTSEKTRETGSAKADTGNDKTSMHTSANNHEYLRFDPISGRMRPREQSTTQMSETATRDDCQRIDIPVKTFTGSSRWERERAASSLGRDESQLHSNEVLYMAGPKENTSIITERSEPTTDNAVIQKQDVAQASNPDKGDQQKQKPQYNPTEIKEDDVDLLRASDIRATFFSGQTKQDLAEKKHLLREALEQDYEMSSDRDTDNKILQELRSKSNIRLKESAVDDQKVTTGVKTSTEALGSIHSPYIPVSEKPTIQSQEADVRQGLCPKDALEVGHVSVRYSTTQSCINSTKSTGGSTLNQTVENTKHFIKEARNLSINMLQICERLEAFAVPTSNTFRVLAYDSASSQIVCAETTSMMPASERIRHPADVLLHVNNPAKFLPYFARMKADGYEIVSGGDDILIFQKSGAVGTRGAPVASADNLDVKFDAMVSMDDRTNPPAIDSSATEGEDSASHSTSNQGPSNPRMVHRQEIVYTGGPPNWSPYRSSTSSIGSQSTTGITEAEPSRNGSESSSSSFSKIGKAIRRIFLSGVATAGTFYAVGVVCEYFLTGGQDGLGPEGFTEFEAERRRRG